MIANFKKNKRNNSFKTILSAILLGALLLVILGMLIGTNIKIKKRREELALQIEKLENEIQMLGKKNEELKKKISQAGTKDFLEKVAREQFGLKAPGEEVVVISKENEEKKETEASEKRSFWDFRYWWEWLKNKLRD